MNKIRIPDPEIGSEIGFWTVESASFGRKNSKNRTVRHIEVRCRCGKRRDIIFSHLLNGKTEKCLGCAARSRTGVKAPAWKGGRKRTGRGYILVLDHGHPNANKKGYVAEHVLVMSDYLGRPLLDHENVHHKNGIRDDNRIENLELWNTGQPAGQRVEDKVTWAKELLKMYEPASLDKEVLAKLNVQEAELKQELGAE